MSILLARHIEDGRSLNAPRHHRDDSLAFIVTRAEKSYPAAGSHGASFG